MSTCLRAYVQDVYLHVSLCVHMCSMYMYMRMLLAYCLASLGVLLVLLMLLFRNLRHIVRALRTQKPQTTKKFLSIYMYFQENTVYNLWQKQSSTMTAGRWGKNSEPMFENIFSQYNVCVLYVYMIIWSYATYQLWVSLSAWEMKRRTAG